MDFQAKRGFGRFDVFNKGTFTKADVTVAPTASPDVTVTADAVNGEPETAPQADTEQQGE